MDFVCWLRTREMNQLPDRLDKKSAQWGIKHGRIAFWLDQKVNKQKLKITTNKNGNKKIINALIQRSINWVWEKNKLSDDNRIAQKYYDHRHVAYIKGGLLSVKANKQPTARSEKLFLHMQMPCDLYLRKRLACQTPKSPTKQIKQINKTSQINA